MIMMNRIYAVYLEALIHFIAAPGWKQPLSSFLICFNLGTVSDRRASSKLGRTPCQGGGQDVSAI
jgi:hypothetical protein